FPTRSRGYLFFPRPRRGRRVGTRSHKPARNASTFHRRGPGDVLTGSVAGFAAAGRGGPDRQAFGQDPRRRRGARGAPEMGGAAPQAGGGGGVDLRTQLRSSLRDRQRRNLAIG